MQIYDLFFQENKYIKMSTHQKAETQQHNEEEQKNALNNIDVKVESEAVKKRATITKRKKSRKRRRDSSSDAARDEMDMWQTVQQRYGTKKKVQNELKEALFDPSNGRIFHSSSYERMMARSVEAHLNRMLQPETPNDLVDSNWLCALCLKPSCADDQGELYGPYFVRLSAECQPPTALLATGGHIKFAKSEATSSAMSAVAWRGGFSSSVAVPPKQSTTSSSKKLVKCLSSPPKSMPTTTVQGSLDIWLHGDCALWAPELFLVGGRLPTLQLHIKRYWKQGHLRLL